MYRIILVEDEPAAAENIHDIVRLYCPQFEIIGGGDNGAAGLALARQYIPDLLLTDIRMPIMDGLELITCLHEEMPQVKTMILSGYQDFEYARTALKHRAVDYLLKPISPQTLTAALNRVIPLLNETKADRLLPLLHSLITNERSLLTDRHPDRETLKKHFRAPEYTVAISRKNGLPGRFRRNMFHTQCRVDGETIDIYGRDEMESLHLEAGDAMLSPPVLEGVQWLHRDVPGYTTTVVWYDVFPIEELPGIINALYAVLDRRLVIGKTQFISVGGRNRKHTIAYPPPDGELRQGLGYYLKEHKIEFIRTLVLDQVKKWEAQGQPQLYIEEMLRPVFETLRQEFENPAGEEGFEFMLEDAFFYAASCEELRESLLFILEKILPGSGQRINKVDTPEFFALIREYLDAHVNEPLNLQSLCRHFGISQTYMSRLFRKYTGLSFINYLTSLRIEKAKDYLLRKDALVKDAAAMSGFTDQFYFSRVFRSMTGQSPSDYIRLNTT
ncbi:MAG: response regulator [Spirochaetaceae bacterium]|jgi:two-component system response regulator YesN|nr:response regulator [Spirochaetaceae bacterium]